MFMQRLQQGHYHYRILLILMLSFLGTGCVRHTDTTPAERERAKEVLEETSPRNMNELPKVVPELHYKIP